MSHKHSTVYSKGEDGGDPSQVCPLQAVSGPRGRRAAESTGTRHDTWQSTRQNRLPLTTKTIIKCRLCPKISALFHDEVSVLDKLLTPASDARFHFGRKLTGTEISVLHQVNNAKITQSYQKLRKF